MTSLTVQASETVQTSNAVFRRVLLLYGAFTLLANAAYLFGYYLLPAGFMRGSPQTAAGQVTALGYVCIVAATVPLGVYQYKSWWRWSGEWRATKIMSFRDIRLTTWEWLVLLLGILLIIFAAYRDTLLARGML